MNPDTDQQQNRRQANIYPGRKKMPDWYDPDISQINRMPVQTDLIPFPSFNQCRHALSDNPRSASPRLHLLNGTWDFKYYDSILLLPETILSFRSGFEPIQVPGCWPLQGNGPLVKDGCFWKWPIQPPFIDSDQPVGVYHHTIQIPHGWLGLHKKLVFQGVSQAFHVFVNSKLVGYSQSSHLPATFDITQLLHDGQNELFVLVYPASSDQYLDHQSPFRLPGIFRDVWMEAFTPVCLHAVGIRTVRIRESGEWTFDILAEILSYRISTESPRIRIRLFDGDVCLLDEGSPVQLKPVDDPSVYASPVQTMARFHQIFQIGSVESWTAETPTLYDLYISISDQQDREFSCSHLSVGFRQLGVTAGQPSLNGRPLKLFGVRYRCWQPETGLTLPLATMIRDLRLMKEHRVNCIHFLDGPPDPILLELCDIFGLYVIDETDCEPLNDLIKQDSDRLAATIKLRVDDMMRRDGNHACLIGWSAGRNLAAWPGLDVLSAHIRKTDDSRFIVAEKIPGRLAEVFFPSLPDQCWRYDSWLCRTSHRGPADLPAWLGRQLSCSADDWIGCSMGEWCDVDLIDAQQKIHAYRLTESDRIGWPDYAMKVYPGNGVGLVQADRTPSPLLKAIKAALSPLLFERAERSSSQYRITNRQSFLGTDLYVCSWQVMQNSQVMAVNELELPDLHPGDTALIQLDEAHFDIDRLVDQTDPADYQLILCLDLRQSQYWGQSGQPVSEYEFILRTGNNGLSRPQPPERLPEGAANRLRLEEDRHHIIVSGHRFWMVFNRLTGQLESWRNGDKEYLAGSGQIRMARQQAEPGQAMQMNRPAGSFESHFAVRHDLNQLTGGGPRLCLSRPFDRIEQQLKNRCEKAGYLNLSERLTNLTYVCDHQTALIEVTIHLVPPARQAVLVSYLRYEINALGQLSLFGSLDPCRNDLPMLPRLGHQLDLHGSFRHLSWYGLGAGTDYPGLSQWARTGFYQVNLRQSPGHQPVRSTSVRWLSLQDDSGFGLQVYSDHNLAFQTSVHGQQQTAPLQSPAADHLAAPAATAWYAHQPVGLILDQDEQPVLSDWQQQRQGLIAGSTEIPAEDDRLSIRHWVLYLKPYVGSGFDS